DVVQLYLVHGPERRRGRDFATRVHEPGELGIAPRRLVLDGSGDADERRHVHRPGLRIVLQQAFTSRFTHVDSGRCLYFHGRMLPQHAASCPTSEAVMVARAAMSQFRVSNFGIPALFMMLVLPLLLALAPLPAQGQPVGLETFLPAVDPGELVPGADRFGPITDAPTVVAPAYRGSDLVGYAFLTSQYVDTAGYSSKPIHVVVGIDTEGTIVGQRLVAHSEPIVLIGIP